MLFNWNGGYSPLSITSNSLLHTHSLIILEYTHSLIITRIHTFPNHYSNTHTFPNHTRIHTFPNHTRIHILHSKTIWESMYIYICVLVKFEKKEKWKKEKKEKNAKRHVTQNKLIVV